MTFTVSGVVFDVNVEDSGVASLIVISAASSSAKEFIAEVAEKGWASEVQPVRKELSVGLPTVGTGYELTVRTYDSFGADLVKGSAQAVRVTRGVESSSARTTGTAPAVAMRAQAAQPPRTGTPALGWILVLGLIGGVAWYMNKPSDVCESTKLLAELDQGRSALGAGDYVSALSKSNIALVTCSVGPRADELGRLQATALNGVLAEGRRCLREMDPNCLLRVRGGLAPMTQHTAVVAFTSEFERDVGARTDKDLDQARRCIAKGDLDCAEQRMKLPLALRRTATPVQAMNDIMQKARASGDAAKACLATDKVECAAAALDNLRSVSPQSPLVMALVRRQAEVSPPHVEASRSEPGTSLPSTSVPTPTPAPVGATAARLGPPDIRIGDRWVLRTTDHNNPTWSNITERFVTEVSAAGMTLVSRNVKSNYRRVLTFTSEWNLLAEREPNGSGASYAPPMRYLSFPLEIGKTWRAEVRKQRLDGSPEQVYSLAGEVQGIERVQVTAGTFDAMKVVLRVEVRENGVLLSQSTDTSWYSPEARRSVKTEEVNNDLRRDQQFRRSIELVEYSVPR